MTATERLCDGARDVGNQPMCDGPNRQVYDVTADTGEEFPGTVFCEDCAAMAPTLGLTLRPVTTE